MKTGNRLIGMGVGVVVGSYLTSLLTRAWQIPGADAYVVMVGLVLLIAGSVVLAKSQKNKNE